MENQTNEEHCENALSETQINFVATFSWWLETFGYLLVGLLGLLLNIIAMLVLLTPTMWNNFFNRLIMCLAGYDSAFILCGILEIFRRWQLTFLQQYLFVKVLYPFRSMVMCCSIYTTLVLTLERHQAITSPIQYRSRGSQRKLGRRLFIYIVPVMLFSFAYYFPKYFDLDVLEVTNCPIINSIPSNTTVLLNLNAPNCTTKYRITPTPLRTNHQYIFWYINVSNLVVTCVLPISLLIFMNCRIVSSLNKFRRRRPSMMMNTPNLTTPNTTTTTTTTQHPKNTSDVKKTFMLFSIVMLFILCHALRIMMNITEFLNLETLALEREKGCDGIKFWQHVSRPLSEFLLLFNSSANFFVYMFFDKAFQQILRKRFYVIKTYFQRTNRRLETDTTPIQGPREIVPVPRENATRTNEIELVKMECTSRNNSV